MRFLCSLVLASSYRESLMLDKTLEFILQFAESNGETLVLATADHECGGRYFSCLGLTSRHEHWKRREKVVRTTNPD